MSRNVNVVTVEFKAVGDGLKTIEDSLKRIKGAGGGGGAGSSFDALTKSAQQATQGIQSFGSAAGLLPSSVGPAVSGITQMAGSFGALGGAIPIVGVALAASAVSIGIFTAGISAAISAVVSLAQATIPEAEKLRRAFLGLESVARFQGINPAAATSAVQNLQIVRDGLISVGEASTALKNLLRSGFGLEQSVEVLKRFGDAAAFGRQGSLEFGQAIVSGTEGLKNRMSILVDNVGVTKNLSVIMKEAGFALEDLDSKTKGAAAQQALFAGLMRETQANLGDAAKLAQGYAGAMARIDVAYTAILQKIGKVIEENVALNEALKLVGEALAVVNRNFDGILATLALFAPVLQVVLSLLSPFAIALAGLIANIGTAIGALAALREFTGIGDEEKTKAMAKFGVELEQLGAKAGRVAASLPADLTKISDAVKGLGDAKNPAFLIAPVLDLIAKIQPASLQSLAESLTAESAKRAKIEADTAERQVAAFSKAIDLERERQSILAHTAIVVAGAVTGQNPLAVSFDQAQQKLQEDAARRLAEEVDRLGKERAKILSEIATESAKKKPDTALVSGLKASLKDLDDAAVTFAAVAEATTSAQEEALRVDFVNKFADQLQKANDALFGVLKAIHDDNPFVTIFTSAQDAVASFKQSFQGSAADLEEFQRAVDALTEKQASAARVSLLSQNFALLQRQQAFAGQAGIGPIQDVADTIRAIFDQFDRLKGAGVEGLKAANKFLTDAATAGQLDVNLLLPSQADQVFQAFTDLQTQVASQEQAAKDLAADKARHEKEIEDARLEALTNNSIALVDSATSADALAVVVAKLIRDGFARFEITMGAEETIKNVAVSGTGAVSDT